MVGRDWTRKTVVIDGYEFVISEPDWEDAFRVGELLFTLVGDPETIVEALAKVEDEGEGSAIDTVIGLFGNAVSRPFKNPAAVADLMALVTDKDAAWFTVPDKDSGKRKLSLPGMIRLVKEALPVIPFDSTWQEVAGIMAMFGLDSRGSGKKSRRSSPRKAGGRLKSGG